MAGSRIPTEAAAFFSGISVTEFSPCVHRSLDRDRAPCRQWRHAPMIDVPRRSSPAGRHPAPADPYVSPHRGHRWYSGQRDHGHDPARVDSPRWWRDTPTCFAYRTKSLSDAKMAIPLDAAAAQIRKSVCGPWTPALRHIYRRGLSPARSGLLVVVVSIVIHFPEERGDLEIRGHIPPPRRT